ncbi:hypothetical protein AJ85_20000 [Alkalihalobacillus alcalophilus ATCC 27647 = CGMCC 1.3604]|uniref:Arginine decarboxylase n=1 Tax=Alkalihalobacillus alcalophilus ATCC 27647 = CGMCC 1.3604 TaxID=1218173 RepID=A0A094WFC6_ALKAL|nr:aminotransferase class I/II-fold pyridoxal phosphate-dependent enzyme [Alkalihalobacillus alcalophilus]KGA96469.1 hypothetical protein BALCAV_0216125 [Alkalihalobacillus alcalophilus ATCC 27647 = CGMCC 1.3604]MED1560582.1 aminotransferase class I/II-fold pyridoxal phosphate-dependent enzyme [Alkalihalobacillus alcalophilus]THG89010.1 hypothetical protein AJ85_20000 [Alkalihalobacillus alcalophilus ATCC 27647 = CGMCC 1.3604]
MRTPLIDTIQKHREKQSVSFHVPGHKNGAVFPKELSDLQVMMSYDLTEIEGLDDLHDPQGPILESEKLLASFYGTKKSYYLVNGSTVGNLAMIYASFQKGDYVFVQRNCHKSVLNALKVREVIPVFLEPEYDEVTGQAVGIDPSTLKAALKKFPDSKGIIFTYPNYYGISLSLKPLIQIAKEFNLKVIVDEAHGAHFILGEPFPPSAVMLGADMVVQSAHKMLPALTMSAYLHVSHSVNNEEIKKLQQALAIFQSSSPSYLLLVSLEGARAFLQSLKKEDVETVLAGVERLKAELNSIPQLEVVQYENSSLQSDPLKVTIRSMTNLTGFELQRLFSQYKLETELADEHHVLLVCGFIAPASQAITSISLLREQLKFKPVIEKRKIKVEQRTEKVSTLQILETERYETTVSKWNEAVGKVAAETVIPYPPGVPLLYRGEKIEQSVLEQMERLAKAGARFQGYDAKKGSILTIDLEEV